MTNKKDIAVLITCYNRKDITLRSLECLFNQAGKNVNFNFKVFLVDDGSNDGTSEEIRIKFPEVKIIDGSGSLYWNRGMYLAWETAVKESYDYDYYLWLNDDVILDKTALNNLLLNINPFELEIICGATYWMDKSNTTYSGYDYENKMLTPNGFKQQCSFFNGNIVLVPRMVFEILGNLEYRYRHSLGDFDYGYRAAKKNIKSYICPEHLGQCEGNMKEKKFLDSQLNVLQRLKFLYHPLSGSSPLEFFLLAYRKSGSVLAVKYLITIHLRVVFPSLFSK